jgi:hypothetical protein
VLRVLVLGLVMMALASAVPPPAVGEVTPAPISGQRRYLMNARIRPLLFWLRKNDVGEARITWRKDRNGAHGYELLVGSDPLKAPRKINKWGYLAEHISGEDATIVGVMKQAKAESVEEAEQQLAREGEGGFAFETISAEVSGDRFTVGTVLVRTPGDLTFRDLESLLARAAAASAPLRTSPLPGATAPGFLSAVADILRETSAGAAQSGGRPRIPSARAYIYNGRLYDLRLQSLDRQADFAAAGRRYGPALEGDFTVTNRTTRHTTRFSIVYGTGELAGVPFKIVFRPKWWFEAELLLLPDDEGLKGGL